MTGTSEDLVVAGRTLKGVFQRSEAEPANTTPGTMGFRQGRVSSGCLSCALGPACLSRHVSLEKVALAGRGGSA